VPRRDPRRYAAPAAFLLAATIAILLIRSGLRSGTTGATTTAVVVRSTPGTTVATTTSKSTTTPSGPRFWTVHAGDTFAVISAKTGVSVATIERLNPNVKSTSLFVGQKLRLR
jgi:LysM repeat protein